MSIPVCAVPVSGVSAGPPHFGASFIAVPDRLAQLALLRCALTKVSAVDAKYSRSRARRHKRSIIFDTLNRYSAGRPQSLVVPGAGEGKKRTTEHTEYTDNKGMEKVASLPRVSAESTCSEASVLSWRNSS